MNTKLSKHVRKAFSALLAERLPRFEKAPNPWDDADLYVWKATENISCFLYLLFWPGKEKFTLEIAWSQKGQFPFSLIGRTLGDGPVNGEIRFRISDLWQIDTRRDTWWGLQPDPTLSQLKEAITQKKEIPIPKIDHVKHAIDDLTKDAVDKVCKFVVPYFERMVNDCIAVPPPLDPERN